MKDDAALRLAANERLKSGAIACAIQRHIIPSLGALIGLVFRPKRFRSSTGVGLARPRQFNGRLYGLRERMKTLETTRDQIHELLLKAKGAVLVSDQGPSFALPDWPLWLAQPCAVYRLRTTFNRLILPARSGHCRRPHAAAGLFAFCIMERKRFQFARQNDRFGRQPHEDLMATQIVTGSHRRHPSSIQRRRPGVHR